MLTLNQIKNRLISFFEGHAQIHTVKYETDFEFNAEGELIYPVANIEYLESNVQNKTVSHSFLVTLGDLTDANVKGLDDEIISDMLLVAEDFYTFLQYSEGFDFNKTVYIQKFLDDTHDRVSGITFTINLSVVRSQNDCATPTVTT
jgi:hypothetical protein